MNGGFAPGKDRQGFHLEGGCSWLLGPSQRNNQDEVQQKHHYQCLSYVLIEGVCGC
jgi:hypothetical protein